MKLRYRLLLLMTLSATLAMGLFFAVSFWLIVQDKKLEVFDRSFENVGLRAQKIKDFLDSTFQASQLLVVAQKASQSKDLQSSVFSQNPHLRSLWLLTEEKGRLNIDLELTQPGLRKLAPADFSLLQDWRSQAPQGESGLFRGTQSSTEFFVWRRVRSASDTKTMYLLIFVDWKSLKSVLTSVGDTHFALQVTGQGFIEAEEEHPQSFLFEKIWASNPSLKESASTLEFKQDDHAGIVSTARVMGYPLTLMSVISSRSAYSVVYQLMTQGSILFIFVLGLIGMGAVFIAKSIASRLELIFRVTNQISQGDFHVQLPTHHKDEIGVLSGQIVKMASDLTNYISEVKEKGRMQAELETANEVQNTLFPPGSWACPQLYLSGKVLPASECGGDWWYYFERAGFLYFFQCDATGHGVPAALITSAARSATSVIERSGETDLKKIVGTLSNAIYDSSNTKLMMTAFAGKINLSTLHLEYVNASHENPVIFSEGSDFEYLIQPINPRLGQRENQAYNSGFYQLKKGQKIFIYTDGLFAVTSPQGKTIGERRGLKMVRQIIDQNKTPSDAISGIALWTKDLAEGLPYPDDITISLIQV